MPATLEQFAPLLNDERFKGLDPAGKAEFRDKAFVATVGADPDRRAVFEQLPPERQAKLRETFTERFDTMYRAHFTIETGPPQRKRREVSMEPGVPPAIEEYEETPRRPVLDTMTERFLKEVGEGKVDPTKFDKKTLIETGAIVEAYAPDKAGPWRQRAEDIAKQEFLPESDTARPFVASAALGAGGAVGPAVRITDWISRKTGLRKPDEPLFQESFQGLNPENQALLKLAFPELSGSTQAGAALALTGIGLRTASALQSAGVNLASKAGIAADAAITGGIGGLYGPEAPGILASIAEKPDNYALNAIEASLFSAVIGTAMREVTKRQMLTRARDAFKFTGSDGELLDYLRDLYRKMPRTVEGTAKTVDPAAEAAAAAKPAAGEAPLALPTAAAEPPAIAPKPDAAPPPTRPADIAPPPVEAPPAAAIDDSAPEFSVKLPDDPKAVIKGKWRVVESDAIRSSRDPGYDANLQPRDRTRAASTQQVSNIARTLDPDQLADSITSDLGSPIVNANGDVLSGNGRTEAIREAYGSESRAANYKEWLTKNAERFGLTSEQVAGMNRPILVRQTADLAGIDEAEFARRSNPEEKTLRMSDAENAASDAAALIRNESLLGKFRPSEDGDVMAASNRDFLNDFIATLGNRGEFIAKDGQGFNVAKLAPRVRNAILAAVVGPSNRTLIDSLVEDSEGMKRVTAGLLNTAPKLLRLQGSEFDLSPSLTKALHDYTAIRASGEPVDEFLAQSTLFGDGGRTAESDFILRSLTEAKSAKAVTEMFSRYHELASKIDTTTPDMFGESNASRLDILKRAANPDAQAGEQTRFSPGEPSAADGGAEPAAGSVDEVGAGETVRGGKSGVSGNVRPAPEAGVGGDLGEPQKRAGKTTADDRDAVALVIELPEMVQLARDLLGGKYPKILEKLRALKGNALGLFRYTERADGVGSIELRADIFDLVSEQEKRALKQQAVEYAQAMKEAGPKVDEARVARERYEQILGEAYEAAKRKNPKLASKVLAHEIGHLVDWLPDKIISGRGNLLARIASLKKFTKSVLPNKPGAPGELTEADRGRLRREAAKLAEAERTKAGIPDDVDPGVSPEEILEIWQSTSARDKDPGLYDYVASMTPEQKKQLVKAAMRGKVADWFVFKRDQLPNLTKSEQEFYAELLKEEIRKRRLFALEEMKNELRPLIAWWRGTQKMEAYFEPSEEMYAETFSILLNNPAAVAKRAPLFYEAFFNYLERKPEVKRLYSQLQDDIKSGQIYRDRVINLRQSWAKADELGLRADEMSATYPLAERLDAFRLTIDRIFGPVYRRMKVAKGVPAERAEKAIENYLYRATMHELFLRRLNFEVMGQLHDFGLDWVDLGEYMFHQHVINNRANIASSQGFNPKASSERLSEMAEQIGAERFAALEFSRANYRSVYEGIVIGRLRDANVLDDKLLALIEERSFYATMSAVQSVADVPPDSIEAALRGRYGDHVSSRIYKQVGYLGDVKNPATATAQKALSLISMSYQEQAKRAIVQFLLESGDELVQEAPMRWTGARREPVEVLNDRLGTLVFLEAGKVRAYYVPRAIYDAFENGNPLNSMLMATIYKAVSPIKAIYTELNYGFWPVALMRDVRGSVMKLPNASVFFGSGAMAPKIFGKARQAAKASLTGKPNKLADEALRRQMVISRAEPRGEAAADDTFERMLLRFGMNPESWRNENLSIGKMLVEAWNWYKRQGQINERAVKIAGMMHLDQHFPTMPELIKQRLVHEAAGSPNFLQRPRAGPILDLFALFYNPWKEGLRAEVRSWKRDPYSRFAKFAFYTATGALTMWMLEKGLLEGLLSKEDSDELRDLYRSIPEYDKTNYHCIPLGWSDKDQKKVLYIRLPLEEGERLQNGLLRKALTQGEGGEGAMSYAGGQVPGINPVLDAAKNWWTFAVLGKNPYDALRGRDVIRPDVFEAGQGTEALAKHTANQLGAGLFIRFSEPSLYDPPKEGVDKFLALPMVSNLLGRWIKVSNRGLFDEAQRVTEPIRKQRAEMRVIGQEMLRKLNNGELFTDSERELLRTNEYLLEYLGSRLPAAAARRSSPEARILLDAKSKEERVKLIESMGPP